MMEITLLIKEKAQQKNVAQMLMKIKNKLDEKNASKNENRQNALSNEIEKIEMKIMNSLSHEFKNEMAEELMKRSKREQIKEMTDTMTEEENHLLAMLSSQLLDKESIAETVNRVDVVGKDKELNEIFVHCEIFYRKLSKKLKTRGIKG